MQHRQTLPTAARAVTPNRGPKARRNAVDVAPTMVHSRARMRVHPSTVALLLLLHPGCFYGDISVGSWSGGEEDSTSHTDPDSTDGDASADTTTGPDDPTTSSSTEATVGLDSNTSDQGSGGGTSSGTTGEPGEECELTEDGCRCDGILAGLDACGCTLTLAGCLCEDLGLVDHEVCGWTPCDIVEGQCLCEGVPSDPSECGPCLADEEAQTCTCPGGLAPLEFCPPPPCDVEWDGLTEAQCLCDGRPSPIEACGPCGPVSSELCACAGGVAPISWCS